MDSFEQMGQAQLLAQQGKREIADAVVGLIKRAFRRMIVMMMSHDAPGPFLP